MLTLSFRLLIVLLTLGVRSGVAQDTPAMDASTYVLRGTYVQG
jgi:hypothetical protein